MKSAALTREDDEARLYRQLPEGAAPDTGKPSSSDESEFAEAMLTALRARVRCIAPRFLYDAAGCALYERICETADYYLTRAEVSILREHATDIARAVGPRADVVEFGAGNLYKAGILLGALLSPSRYVPVDVALDHANGAALHLRRTYPGLVVEPLASDFMRPLRLPPPARDGGRRVGLFLGSTIGNLSVEEAHNFLARTARLFAGGGLLIGVDLVKDPAVLHKAYNDRSGVTAKFNRNLLVRANRELQADFDTGAFEHYAFYEPRARRIEMHLVSARAQRVQVCGYPFDFQQGESLLTEVSHKYAIEDFHTLAVAAGLVPKAVWCDRRQRFSLHWLVAPAP